MDEASGSEWEVEDRKLQEFAQGFQVPRIIAVRHNPPFWELETTGLNPDVGNILVTWTSSFILSDWDFILCFSWL